jgi:methylated-DNA-[protein]-cysteine S-methyltransferase
LTTAAKIGNGDSRHGYPRDGYQLVVAAPSFCIGLRCDENEIHGLDFLEPGPQVPPANALAAQAGNQLRAYLADADVGFNLPLRASGTAFQRRVWEQIAAIACHQTKSYGELARILDNAPRAVGQACGANPFPLIVPCHRVIASTGGLGGFARQRGGFLIDVKRWLLAHERP